MAKTPYSQRTFRGKLKYSILFFVILVAVTIVLWVVTLRGYQLINIAKHNKKVGAPLIGYDVTKITATDPFTVEILYNYKYTDENGVVYKGSVRTHIHDYATADKAVESGQTVEIYIDGKGNSFPANTEISQTKCITVLVFSIILTVGSVVFFIVFLIPKKIKPNGKT